MCQRVSILGTTSSKVEIGQEATAAASCGGGFRNDFISHSKAPAARLESPSRRSPAPATVSHPDADHEPPRHDERPLRRTRGMRVHRRQDREARVQGCGIERKGGRVHIAKAAVQGEFGAKKFIKPRRTGTKSQQQYAPKGFVNPAAVRWRKGRRGTEEARLGRDLVMTPRRATVPTVAERGTRPCDPRAHHDDRRPKSETPDGVSVREETAREDVPRCPARLLAAHGDRHHFLSPASKRTRESDDPAAAGRGGGARRPGPD